MENKPIDLEGQKYLAFMRLKAQQLNGGHPVYPKYTGPNNWIKCIAVVHLGGMNWVDLSYHTESGNSRTGHTLVLALDEYTYKKLGGDSCEYLIEWKGGK